MPTSKAATLARIESTKITRQSSIRQQVEDKIASVTVLPFDIDFLSEDIAVVEEVMAEYREEKGDGEPWDIRLSKREEGRTVYIVATFS